jgi:hypothetical protein
VEGIKERRERDIATIREWQLCVSRVSSWAERRDKCRVRMEMEWRIREPRTFKARAKAARPSLLPRFPSILDALSPRFIIPSSHAPRRRAHAAHTQRAPKKAKRSNFGSPTPPTLFMCHGTLSPVSPKRVKSALRDTLF